MKFSPLEQLLLEKIPEHPPGIATTDLLDAAERAERERGESDGDRRALQRRVQRALGHLLAQPDLGLECAPSKPHRWHWQPGKKRQFRIHMDTATALALGLLRRHLDSLIPEPQRAELEPLFQKAVEIVQRNVDARIKRWETRAAIAPAAFSLRPPQVKPEVLAETRRALLERNQLLIDYRKPGAVQARQHQVHPQGLVLCDGVFYLFATLEKRSQLITFVLHRIEHAQASTETSRDIPDFDVNRYVVGQSGLQFLTGKDIKLRLRVSRYLGHILRERPLSEQQEIRDCDEEWCEVTATVPESEQIEWWIGSWGEQCEVLAPKPLRERMAERALKVRRLYANKPKKKPHQARAQTIKQE